MLEWLFKYNPEQFRVGSIGFENAGLMLAVALVLGVVVLLAIFQRTRVYSNRRDRVISLGLRLVVIVLLFIPFFEPVLISPDVVPDENFVAVVVDASESMSIEDADGGLSRLATANRVLFDTEVGIDAELRDHFQLRYYAFDNTASRVDSVDGIGARGTGTSLSAVLDKVSSDFRGVPLSGVVLLTDGGDNSNELPLNAAERLAEADIPLHVVGVGSESFSSEREILEVDVSKAVEENTGAEIDVKVRSWSQEEGVVNFRIYQGDNVVFEEARTLKGNGRIDQHNFFFESLRPGVGEYRIEVEPGTEEINIDNNSRELLIDTRSDTTRVLYFEGALRQDFKFIKRALEDDQVIEFVSVSRTGTGKYYRQGVRSSDELAGGFPREESELYGFKAVILGDIEASNFSVAQMAMLEDFVRVRGGGLLMLGGKNSFADGGYANTPVAEVLPVRLDPSRRVAIPENFSREDREPANQGFKFAPTAAGLDDPILKLSPDRRTNTARWASMPGLTSINYLGSAKPGARVLATKTVDEFGGEEPLLVTQRYGRGRSSVLATSSTWRWQMLLDSEDARHERFWRQLVRSLAAEAPDAVNIAVSNDDPEPGQEVELRVEAFDGRFDVVEGAEVSGVLRDPFGSEMPVRFNEQLGTSGAYTATAVPRNEGVYHLAVTVSKNNEPVGVELTSFLVRKSRKEFSDATLKAPLLTSMAGATNGGYYRPADAADIPERLRSRKTTTTIYTSNPLWDMPFLWILVVSLLGYEWYRRRKKGLA